MKNIQRIIEAAINRAGNPAVIAELENLQWAPGYAEPGYSNPKSGVCFADWNDKGDDKTMSRVGELLEKAGAGIEWSDEWAMCSDCGRAVRTSPDSYSWLPNYVILNGCELVCHACVDEEAYLKSIEGKTSSACTFVDPEKFGYVALPVIYETGLYPGQNDKPEDVAKALKAKGVSRFVFAIISKGQFGAAWRCYVHTSQAGKL